MPRRGGGEPFVHLKGEGGRDSKKKSSAGRRTGPRFQICLKGEKKKNEVGGKKERGKQRGSRRVRGGKKKKGRGKRDAWGGASQRRGNAVHRKKGGGTFTSESGHKKEKGGVGALIDTISERIGEKKATVNTYFFTSSWNREKKGEGGERNLYSYLHL